jgi:hypothetical protein
MRGSHELGARITWTHLGNQQYVFHLELVGDPQGVSLPSAPAISYSQGMINLSRDTIRPFLVPFSQHNPPEKYAEIHHYTSAPVTLSSLPPQGYRFEYSSCCLSADIVNLNGSLTLYAASTMLPDTAGKAPGFSTYLPLGGEAQPPLAHYGSTGGRHQYWIGSFRPATAGYDSVATALTAVATGQNTQASWTSGYSSAAPLPDASESPQNGPYRYDPLSGIASFRVDSGSQYDDFFLHGVEHQYFKNSQPGAAATIRSVHVVKLVEDSSGNAAPSLSVSNLPSDTLRLYPGDSLSVDYLALDNAQGVIVGAHSWGLDTQYLPAGSPAIQLSSLNSSGGFYGFSLSQARLRWAPDSNSLAVGPLDIPVYLWAIDSVTPGSKRVYHRLLVELRPKVQILQGGRNKVAFSSPVCPLTLRGATKSGQAQWRPAAAVANDTALQTSYTGAASGWVYLQDPAHPQQEDSLYVGVVDTADFTIHQNNTFGFFADSLSVGPYLPPRGMLPAPRWTLNHFPLNESGPNLRAPTNGVYRVEQALRGSCTLRDSNFINLFPNSTGSVALFAPNNLSRQATALQDQSLDSLYGFNFTPPVPSPFLDELHLMGLSGTQGKAADSGHVRVWLYELTNSGAVLLLHRDTLISTRFSGTLTMHDRSLPGAVVLGGQARTHQLIWQVDSSLSVHVLEGDIGPGDTTGFETYQALRGKDTSRLLAQSSRYTLATSMRFMKVYDLEENRLPVRSLHPNPTREMVYWEKPLAETQNALILNTAGQELARISLRAGDTQMTLPDLPEGLYLVKLGAAHYRLRIAAP